MAVCSGLLEPFDILIFEPLQMVRASGAQFGGGACTSAMPQFLGMDAQTQSRLSAACRIVLASSTVKYPTSQTHRRIGRPFACDARYHLLHQKTGCYSFRFKRYSSEYSCAPRKVGKRFPADFLPGLWMAWSIFKFLFEAEA